MPGFSRAPTGGIACHVPNRANAHLPLFGQAEGCEAFGRALEQAYPRAVLSDPPGGWPTDWGSWVNRPQSRQEEDAVAQCIALGRPFGTAAWVAPTAGRLGLQTTV